VAGDAGDSDDGDGGLGHNQQSSTDWDVPATREDEQTQTAVGEPETLVEFRPDPVSPFALITGPLAWIEVGTP